MKWPRTVLREIFGLFVDDGSFALGILVWLIIAGWVIRHFSYAVRWNGVILFGGLALLLVGSAIRFAMRTRARPSK